MGGRAGRRGAVAGDAAEAQAEKGKRGFAASRHWHITLGVALLAGLLFFSATGLTWSQWAGGNIDALRANLGWLTPQVNTSLQADAPQTPADPHAEHRGMMPGMKMGPAAQSNALNGDWDRRRTPRAPPE